MIERLAEAEEELAAACALVAVRMPEAGAALAELETQHVAAAARLRLTRPSPWERAFSRLRAGAPLASLEWLRDRELELARSYTTLVYGGALDSASAHAAWQRYMAVERLLALHEFGELVL